MDEVRRSRRPKTDQVKTVLHSYLQKRNYASISLEPTKLDQQITYSLVENEISRPNSILYSCYNNDPEVISQNFTKFISWIRDSTKTKAIHTDIENIVGPLFCHLYLDILKSGNSDCAGTFFKAHLPAIDKTKCDDFVRDLINLFANDTDATCLKEQFRSNKYLLELSPQSVAHLKKFVQENCHVVFLHVLQTWFDLHETEPRENDRDEATAEMEPPTNGVCSDDKFQKMLDAIHELEQEPKQIFLLKIRNTNEPVTCALIERTTGLVAYNQDTAAHLKTLHSEEIRLSNHSLQIYAMAISPDHTTFATGSADKTLCIYNLTDMDLIKQAWGHLGPIYCLSIGSNNAYIASGSHDTTARLWDAHTGQTLRIFVGHTQPVTCIDFHPNCLYVGTGSADQNIRLWSVDNGAPLRLFHGSKGAVFALAFSPTGDALATAGEDKKVRVWDVLTSKVSGEFKFSGEPILKVKWDGEGRQLCAGGVDGAVRVWNVGQGDKCDKEQVPAMECSSGGRVLSLGYCFETFACVTSD